MTNNPEDSRKIITVLNECIGIDYIGDPDFPADQEAVLSGVEDAALRIIAMMKSAGACIPISAEAVTLYREIDALGGSRSEDGEYNAGFADGYSRALDDALEILTKRGFTESSDASFTCTDCSMAEPEWCMKATYCRYRDGNPATQVERIRVATAQYREAPFRSADWLAGVVMTILETAPGNDAASAQEPAAKSRDPRPDRNCDFCGPGWKGAHKYRCPRAHEDNGEGGPVDD